MQPAQSLLGLDFKLFPIIFPKMSPNKFPFPGVTQHAEIKRKRTKEKEEREEREEKEGEREREDERCACMMRKSDVSDFGGENPFLC